VSTEWRSARIAMLMAKLERHRDNIARLEERRAKYGLNAPLELENELADERAMAMEVAAQLEHLTAGGEDPLDRLFREATRARISGQISLAWQLYKQIHSEDPTYPNIEWHVLSTERELGRDYIDNGGEVVPNRVISPRPTPERLPTRPTWQEWVRPIAGAIAVLLAVSAALVTGGHSIITTRFATPTLTLLIPVPTWTHTASPTPTHTPSPTLTDTLTPTLVPTDTPIPPTPILTPLPPTDVPTLAPTSTKRCFDTRFQRIEDAEGLQEVRGYVYDMNGQGLQNAVVEIYVKGYWSQVNKQTNTTEDGGFAFIGYPLDGGINREYILRVIGMPDGATAYNTWEEPYTFKFNTGHDRTVVFIYEVPFQADLCHPPNEVQ